MSKNLHINKIQKIKMFIQNGELPKNFVLHDLPENYWETEEETFERVIRAIYDTLNVDISGMWKKYYEQGKKERRDHYAQN